MGIGPLSDWYGLIRGGGRSVRVIWLPQMLLLTLRFQQLERKSLAVVASQVTCTLTWLPSTSVLGVWKAEMVPLLRFLFLPCPMTVSNFQMVFITSTLKDSFRADCPIADAQRGRSCGL